MKSYKNSKKTFELWESITKEIKKDNELCLQE